LRRILTNFSFNAVTRVFLFLFTLIIITSCSNSPVEETSKVYTVRVVRAVIEPLFRTIELSGNVVARYKGVLSFQVAGQMTGRSVDTGNIVQAGDLIAQLDPADYELQVENLQGEVNRALSDYETASTDEQRFNRLREKKVISQIQYDRQVNILKSSKGLLDALNANLRIAQNSLKYTRLISKYPGVITSVFAEVGQVVDKGQPIVQLVRTKELEVAVSLPEHSLTELGKAQIEISLWGDENTKYKGAIRELSPEADPKTRTYLAKISIKNQDDRLNLGRTVRVRFLPQSPKTVIRLPISAIWWKGDDAMIWVVNADKLTVAPRKISTGPMDGNKVSIESGIAADEIIVTAGTHKLSPGQSVRIMDQVTDE